MNINCTSAQDAYFQLIDWLIDVLIDWCLTSTFAVFQLYRGVFPFVEICSFNNTQHDFCLRKKCDYILMEKRNCAF